MKALEFFSGIGGMHAALTHAVPGAQVACAYDINEVANDVYEANFGKRPQQGNLAAVPPASLDKHAADLWLLAPPCQPFTRQGLKKDVNDGRASCFMQLLENMKKLKHPPRYLLLENVVGFEDSLVHGALMEMLAEQMYGVQEFILTPTQLGIPYSRPRYFCVAKKGAGFTAPKSEDEPIFMVPPSQLVGENTEMPGVRPIGDFLVTDPSDDNAAASKLTGPYYSPAPGKDGGKAEAREGNDTDPAHQGTGREPPEGTPCEPGVHKRAALEEASGSIKAVPSIAANPACPEIRNGSNSSQSNQPGIDEEPWLPFWVPDKVLKQSADVIDIVTASQHCCKCFTKNYTQFTKGTGSLVAHDWPDSVPPPQSLSSEAAKIGPQGLGTLAPVQKNKESIVAKWKDDGVHLRYFTPKEVANLHSFPSSFFFPAHVTLRQRYQLLGNSLSVAVVADLIKYLLTDGPYSTIQVPHEGKLQLQTQK